MALHRWTLIGLLAVAGLAFWLLVAGPATLLGVDTGNAGMALLMLMLSLMVACMSAYAAKSVHSGRDLQ